MSKHPKGLNKRYPGNRSEALSRFLKDISKYSVLDLQTQTDLAIRAQAGDEKARQRLLESNCRLLVRIANSFSFDNINTDDLIQEGFLGLVTAVERFDPSKGVPFPNYASLWIKKSMLDYAWSEYGPGMRMPANHIQGIRKLIAISSKYLNSNGRIPTMEELLIESKLPEPIVKNYCTMYDCSTFSNLISPDKNPELHLSSDSGADPEEALDKKLAKETLRKCLDTLPERQREILCGHFGIDSVKKSYSEIARRLGMTSENVRQYCERALKNLRKKCGKMLLPFVEE